MVQAEFVFRRKVPITLQERVDKKSNLLKKKRQTEKLRNCSD